MVALAYDYHGFSGPDKGSQFIISLAASFSLLIGLYYLFSCWRAVDKVYKTLLGVGYLLLGTGFFLLVKNFNMCAFLCMGIGVVTIVAANLLDSFAWIKARMRKG